MGFIGTVGLVLHPERTCAPTVEAVVRWSRARGTKVLGLAAEVARIGCEAIPVEAEEMTTSADGTFTSRRADEDRGRGCRPAARTG